MRRLLSAIPGLELVTIPQLYDHGHQCSGFRSAPAARENVHRTVLDQAAAAGVDVLADIYHSCHRELVVAERDYPFAIQNFISLVGEAMGLTRQDLYKRMVLYRDMERVLAEAARTLPRITLIPILCSWRSQRRSGVEGKIWAIACMPGAGRLARATTATTLSARTMYATDTFEIVVRSESKIAGRNIIKVLPSGAPIEVRDMDDTWATVRLEDGRTGYVEKDT